ncbi:MULTISPECIES: hypothetical protein [Pseudomonas]|jgi:hypothetical protein|uniref:Uncharacterized protein n=1 Tax=Pseudomonas extremaustralis TaxID=359110 RepID=A0A5C5Q9Y2_9PSED|nr:MULTISPECIES: hypothetical protein [Pseudomonas]HCE9341571.1 hypothetical protein [Pseudomonas aeruginosa]EZI27792.1 hypothetical protein PE143B_0114700 [Pseudomonas extremaustralis 14-3 substr. 14-3b]MDW8841030.1 hypothetical protein [Pseudomonas carnis]MQT39873.1 hypothetical protein [Pseudomonas sp. FSL R10-0765]NMX67319.1 hypothetical protein [Pseudomonas sp. WS 5111]
MDEISLEQDGVHCTAEYEVHGEELYVYLPDGECRQTTLNGMSAESAALTHLRSYLKKIAKPA